MDCCRFLAPAMWRSGERGWVCKRRQGEESRCSPRHLFQLQQWNLVTFCLNINLRKHKPMSWLRGVPGQVNEQFESWSVILRLSIMIQRDRALNRYNNAVDKNNALVDNNEVIDNGSIGKLRRLFFYNGSDCGSLLTMIGMLTWQC